MVNARLMDLQRLKYFYEVARSGTVTSAAKKLRISTPAVSKMVHLLETSLNHRLFTRTPRRMVLTPEGEQLFQECRQIFARLEWLENHLSGSGQALRGELRLGASDNLCHYLLPAILASFLRRHPQVRVVLYSGTATEIAERLRDGELELGMFYTPIKDQMIALTELERIPFLLVCSPLHPLASVQRLSATKLSTYGFIGSRVRDYSTAYPAQKMLRDLGVKSPSIIECNSQEAQKRMVLQGLGYSLLPRHMVASELKRGHLLLLSVGQRPLHQSIYVARRRSGELSALSREFHACLCENGLSSLADDRGSALKMRGNDQVR